MSTQSDLKENILASKLEVVVEWLVANRNVALTGLGIVVGAILISSVFVIRNRETRALNYTRLAQAEFFISQQKYPQADEILKEIKSTTNNRTLLTNLSYYQGLSALGAKNFDQAAQFFQEAVDNAGSSPIRPLALANLGFAYEEKKDFNSASAAYSRFMAEYGDHFMAPRIQLSLGRSFAQAGRPEESKKALDQLIDLYPTSAWAENARSFIDKNKTP